MKPIIVPFSKGIQFPPKLGSLILKPTAPGRLAYGQNVDSSNDEYGAGIVTPGPQLKLMDHNNKVTGVPMAKVFLGPLLGSSATHLGFLYYAQGLLGNKKTTINRVENIVSGMTPNVAFGIGGGIGVVLDHFGHSNQSIVDMVLRRDFIFNADFNYSYIYISGKDDTDTWVYKLEVGVGSLTSSLVASNGDFLSGLTDQFLVLGSDNNIYWIGQRRVDMIDTANNYSKNALQEGLPLNTYATAGVDWNQNLVVAYSTDAFGDFDRRLSAGKSGVILWDYDAIAFQKNIPAPCRYISVLIVDPTGNLLCFGGIDEGKTSLYEFTGYGFNLLYTYIGDMPRSRHSVEFDGQGRIIWQTADGQICRYDRASGTFDHLAANDAVGGILAKGIGSPGGNEFIVGSGDGSNGYNMRIVSFGNFTGDPEGTGPKTPLAVSGIQSVPFNSTINGITFYLARPLKPGEAVTLLIYVNGSENPTEYLTMDYNVDKAASAKRATKTLPGINNFSLGVIWKMADGQATAPAVMPAEVEIA